MANRAKLLKLINKNSVTTVSVSQDDVMRYCLPSSRRLHWRKKKNNNQVWHVMFTVLLETHIYPQMERAILPFTPHLHPSVLWHCWLGLLTHKARPRMTYNVFGGTLNLAQLDSSASPHFSQYYSFPVLPRGEGWVGLGAGWLQTEVVCRGCSPPPHMRGNTLCKSAMYIQDI